MKLTPAVKKRNKEIIKMFLEPLSGTHQYSGRRAKKVFMR